MIEKIGAGASKTPKEKLTPATASECTLTLTEQCIGAVKGKRRCKDPDAYAAGERSGKHAKPNVLSATALPPLSAAVDFPACASPSTVLASPAEGYSTCAN
jgi:hypothetical protein